MSFGQEMKDFANAMEQGTRIRLNLTNRRKVYESYRQATEGELDDIAGKYGSFNNGAGGGGVGQTTVPSQTTAAGGGEGGGGGGGGSSYTGGTGDGRAGTKTGEIAAYVRESAKRHGVDPDTAIRVANSEGGLTDPFRQGESMLKYGREESYGPFQLHMRNGGVGERALKAGIDPRKDWKGGVDYAMAEASKRGWGQWFGAAKVGIGKWDGIGGRPGGGGDVGIPEQKDEAYYPEQDAPEEEQEEEEDYPEAADSGEEEPGIEAENPEFTVVDAPPPNIMPTFVEDEFVTQPLYAARGGAIPDDTRRFADGGSTDPYNPARSYTQPIPQTEPAAEARRISIPSSGSSESSGGAEDWRSWSSTGSPAQIEFREQQAGLTAQRQAEADAKAAADKAAADKAAADAAAAAQSQSDPDALMNLMRMNAMGIDVSQGVEALSDRDYTTWMTMSGPFGPNGGGGYQPGGHLQKGGMIDFKRGGTVEKRNYEYKTKAGQAMMHRGGRDGVDYQMGPRRQKPTSPPKAEARPRENAPAAKTRPRPQTARPRFPEEGPIPSSRPDTAGGGGAKHGRVQPPPKDRFPATVPKGGFFKQDEGGGRTQPPPTERFPEREYYPVPEGSTGRVQPPPVDRFGRKPPPQPGGYYQQDNHAEEEQFYAAGGAIPDDKPTLFQRIVRGGQKPNVREFKRKAGTLKEDAPKTKSAKKKRPKSTDKKQNRNQKKNKSASKSRLPDEAPIPGARPESRFPDEGPTPIFRPRSDAPARREQPAPTPRHPDSHPDEGYDVPSRGPTPVAPRGPGRQQPAPTPRFPGGHPQGGYDVPSRGRLGPGGRPKPVIDNNKKLPAPPPYSSDWRGSQTGAQTPGVNRQEGEQQSMRDMRRDRLGPGQTDAPTRPAPPRKRYSEAEPSYNRQEDEARGMSQMYHDRLGPGQTDAPARPATRGLSASPKAPLPERFGRGFEEPVPERFERGFEEPMTERFGDEPHPDRFGPGPPPDEEPISERFGEEETPWLAYARGGAIPDEEPPYPNSRAEEANYTTSSADPRVVAATAAREPDVAADRMAGGAPGLTPTRQLAEAEAQPTQDEPPRSEVNPREARANALPAIQVGKNGLSRIFGLGRRQQSAVPVPEEEAVRQQGLRRFAKGEGAATRQEVQTADFAFGLDQVRTDEGTKNLMRMEAAVHWHLQRGDKDKAEAAAASFMLYGAGQVKQAGMMAEVAFNKYQQTGNPQDLRNASLAVQRAHQMIPDGMNMKIDIDPKTRQIVATLIDDDGKATKQVVDPVQIPTLLQSAMDGSAYWKSLEQIGQPEIARTRAAGRRDAASKAEDRRYNEELEQSRWERNQGAASEKEERAAAYQLWLRGLNAAEGQTAGERSEREMEQFYSDWNEQGKSLASDDQKKAWVTEGLGYRYENTQDRDEPLADEDIGRGVLAAVKEGGIINDEDVPQLTEIARAIGIKNPQLDEVGAGQAAVALVMSPNFKVNRNGTLYANGADLVFNPMLLPNLSALRQKYKQQ